MDDGRTGERTKEWRGAEAAAAAPQLNDDESVAEGTAAVV